jgi:hypothetical protein
MGQDSGRARGLNDASVHVHLPRRRPVLALARLAGLVIGALLLVAAVVPVTALAQALADQTVTDEILSLREKVRAAVTAKDRKALEAIYVDGFSHVRETGRIDLKAERIAILLGGEEGVIETAPEQEIVVQAFGPVTAVASGVSPIKDAAGGRAVPFQWLTVYVKLDGAWRVALSQANRLSGRR